MNMIKPRKEYGNIVKESVIPKDINATVHKVCKFMQKIVAHVGVRKIVAAGGKGAIRWRFKNVFKKTGREETLLPQYITFMLRVNDITGHMKKSKLGL